MAKKKSKSSVKSFPKKERRKLARIKRREARATQRQKYIFDFIDDIEIQEYEDEVVRNLFKEQANQKRQITRQENKAAKAYAESWKPEEARKADELNEALNIATDLQKNFKNGNGKYAQYLEPLIQRLDELGYKYDEQMDEGKNFLYKNVRFEELPDDQRVNDLVKKILDLNFSSYENYQEMLIENAVDAYNTMGDRYLNDTQNIAFLLDVMQTSAAWDIAKRNAPNSDQVKTNWTKLYSYADEAQKQGILSDFKEEVMSHPDNYTVEEVEKWLTDALKGD